MAGLNGTLTHQAAVKGGTSGHNSAMARLTANRSKTSSVSTGETVQVASLTDQVSLGGNDTSDLTKMRDLKRQRMEEASRNALALLGVDESTPKPKPKQKTEPSPEPQEKNWLQKFRESRPTRHREGKTHIGVGGLGHQEKGSKSIRWSDGTRTHTAIQHWEKKNYN